MTLVVAVPMKMGTTCHAALCCQRIQTNCCPPSEAISKGGDQIAVLVLVFCQLTGAGNRGKACFYLLRYILQCCIIIMHPC
mmetsp:Transcript_16125/g.24996  ORF Transcript_16125/g.24996 Transcript_16125/m.24996 type:complete len:81 (+) Transcript_16125:485-727(+)